MEGRDPPGRGLFPASRSFGGHSCTPRQHQHPVAGNGFHRAGCLVAEWKPWQQEAGKIFPSPRRKGSLFLGPEPSYSLVLHFDVNFNSGELALRVLGLGGGGLVSDLLPLLSPTETQLLASNWAICAVTRLNLWRPIESLPLHEQREVGALGVTGV